MPALCYGREAIEDLIDSLRVTYVLRLALNVLVVPLRPAGGTVWR